MDTLAPKLRKLRELHNYKQEYVGSIIGLTQTGYSKIENGEVDNISVKHLQKLADLYKITPSQLFDWDGKVQIGTVNGIGINQGTAHVNIPVEERLKSVEDKLESVLSMLGKTA